MDCDPEYLARSSNIFNTKVWLPKFFNILVISVYNAYKTKTNTQKKKKEKERWKKKKMHSYMYTDMKQAYNIGYICF